MSVNPNWARWIFASISKHFDDLRGTLPLYIEGKHRNTRKLKDYLELRMDGPKWYKPSKGYWLGDVQVNVLVTSAMDDDDYHRPHQNSGFVQSLFRDTIDVFKFGDGPDDDQSYLGCLVLQQNRSNGDTLELNHFGIIDVDDPIVQSTVEGHYRIQLCER